MAYYVLYRNGWPNGVYKYLYEIAETLGFKMSTVKCMVEPRRRLRIRGEENNKMYIVRVEVDE